MPNRAGGRITTKSLEEAPKIRNGTAEAKLVCQRDVQAVMSRRGKGRKKTTMPTEQMLDVFERHNAGGNAIEATRGELLHNGAVQRLLAAKRRSAAIVFRHPIVSSVSH